MSDRPQKYGYYFRITIEKKAESQIETIIESNNSRNLLNDSTTRWEAGSNRCLESVLS